MSNINYRSTINIHCLILLALFPLMLFLYRKIINELVNMGKLQSSLNTRNTTINNSSEWYVLLLRCVYSPLMMFSFVESNMSTLVESPHDAIAGIIKYYALLGCLSLLFYWIAWSCWNIAGERQVRRMRYAFVYRGRRLIFRTYLFSVMLFFEIFSDKR